MIAHDLCLLKRAIELYGAIDLLDLHIYCFDMLTLYRHQNDLFAISEASTHSRTAVTRLETCYVDPHVSSLHQVKTLQR